MILILGAGGQLGQELHAAAHEADVQAVAAARADVDVTDEKAVQASIETKHPSLVVNAAAYTAVDRAEDEPDKAMSANATAPGIIASACARHGIPLIQLSTDYVFDGAKVGPYFEEDPIGPLGVYGRSKAAGEAAVRDAWSRHVILRTSWVYGVYGANFLKTMLRLAKERGELRVVADQHGCPTSTRMLAEAILMIAPKLAEANRTNDSRPWGTYHLTGSGQTTWHGFANEIVAAQAVHTGRRPNVMAVATADYPSRAKRPANSVLDNQKFQSTFGYRSPDWRTESKAIVEQLLAKEQSS